MNPADDPLRPAHICAALLAALHAAEGRSRARKRDQTPDTIGLNLRRELLEQAVRDDPDPGDFEPWLLDHVDGSPAPGAVRAIARAVLDEWRLAHQMPSFAAWLAQGAPSEDAVAGNVERPADSPPVEPRHPGLTGASPACEPPPTPSPRRPHPAKGGA